jgi:hypothetical protein
MSQGLREVRIRLRMLLRHKDRKVHEPAGRDSMTHVAYGKWRTPLDRHCNINGRE